MRPTTTYHYLTFPTTAYHDLPLPTTTYHHICVYLLLPTITHILGCEHERVHGIHTRSRKTGPTGHDNMCGRLAPRGMAGLRDPPRAHPKCLRIDARRVLDPLAAADDETGSSLRGNAPTVAPAPEMFAVRRVARSVRWCSARRFAKPWTQSTSCMPMCLPASFRAARSASFATHADY